MTEWWCVIRPIAEVDHEKLTDWLDYEAACLWAQLGWAIRDAHRGSFSIACEGAATRIVSLLRVMGPCEWGKVPWTLVAGGVWLRLHQIAGVVPVMPTEAEWIEYEERMKMTRAEGREKYARTLDQLQDKGVLASLDL